MDVPIYTIAEAWTRAGWAVSAIQAERSVTGRLFKCIGVILHRHDASPVYLAAPFGPPSIGPRANYRQIVGEEISARLREDFARLLHARSRR